MIGFAYAISNNRKAINWRPIFWGIGLQIIFAVLILHLEFGQIFFSGCDRIVNWLLSCADAGTDFVLRSLVTGTVDPSVKNLAFRAIPTIIFFSSFMAILYHLRIMGFIISMISMLMQKTMRTSVTSHESTQFPPDFLLFSPRTRRGSWRTCATVWKSWASMFPRRCGEASWFCQSE